MKKILRSKIIILAIVIFFLSISGLFFNIKKAEAVYLEITYFSFDGRNMIWQVATRIIENYDPNARPPTGRDVGSTWYRWVNETYVSSYDGWWRQWRINNIQNVGTPPYGVKWSTACVDPTVKTWPWFGNHYAATDDISAIRQSDKDEIKKLTGTYYMDLEWGSGRSMCDWPPPPQNDLRGYVFIDRNGDGRDGSGDGCYQGTFDLTVNGSNDNNHTARGCGSGSDPWFHVYRSSNSNTVCLQVPNGYNMTNNRCRNTNGDETIRFGIEQSCQPNNTCGPNQCGTVGNGCGGTKNCGPCTGPIGGTIFMPNGTRYRSGARVFRKPNSSNSWNNNDVSNNQGNYNFAGLPGGSIHDIRLARSGDELGGGNKIDSCLFEPNSNDGTPWVRENAQVPNNNVDFRLHNKNYVIGGQLLWDPDGSGGGGDTRPYTPPTGRDVKITVRGQGSDITNNQAKYSIGGIPTDSNGREYRVEVNMNGNNSVKQAHHVVGGNTKRITISCANRTNVNFYIAPDVQNYNISGTIWLDSDKDGAFSGGDTRYQGNAQKQARIEIVGTSRFDLANNGNGDYTITANPDNGTYDVRLVRNSLKNNFQNILLTNPVRRRVNGANVNNVDFLVARDAVPSWSLSGGLFIDIAPIGRRNAEAYETPFSPESITVTSTTGYNQTFAAGSAEFNASGFYLGGLSAGTYTVGFSGTRNNWGVSYHPQPYRNIRIGSPPPSPSCPRCRVNGQDAEDIDFGIFQGAAAAEPWIQSVGGDLRWDDANFINIVPDGATCSNTTRAYVSSNSVVNGNLSSGIVFTGTGPVFAQSGSQSSKASPNGWLLTGNAFSPARAGTIKTSYTYVKAAIDKGRVDTSPMFNGACSGGGGNCNLRGGLGHGAFIQSGNVTLQGGGTYSFGANQDYVFLINGNLRIETNIDIPTTSTAIFIVSGNITVAGSVTQIEGIYSANGTFTFDGGTNNPLIIEGNIIANAGLSSGNIVNNRDLEAANTNCPAVRVISRPDFILNSPELIRYPNSLIQEVAPQGGN